MPRERTEKIHYAIPAFGEDGHIRPLADVQAELITIAIEYYENKSIAARQLGIGRSTMWQKIKAAEK
jgi:transcriptional regulator with PAS, ATPase and Fis domain